MDDTKNSSTPPGEPPAGQQPEAPAGAEAAPPLTQQIIESYADLAKAAVSAMQFAAMLGGIDPNASGASVYIAAKSLVLAIEKAAGGSMANPGQEDRLEQLLVAVSDELAKNMKVIKGDEAKDFLAAMRATTQSPGQA